MRTFWFICNVLLLAFLTACVAVGILFCAAAWPYNGPMQGITGLVMALLSLTALYFIQFLDWEELVRPFHLFWRWLRQQDKIEEMDRRIADLCEEWASEWERGAELHAEFDNETRHYEYNTRRLEELAEGYRLQARYWYEKYQRAIKRGEQFKARVKLMTWADKTHQRLVK